MNLDRVIYDCIEPAYRLLPPAMNSDSATAQLLANGQQESLFEYTFQKVAGKPNSKGPARGYWQFELGTAASRGGVWGVFLHSASRYWLAQLCAARNVVFAPTQIWRSLETDHVLAAGVARLMLFTDPKPLPHFGDVKGAWALYLRTWRPGAYTRGTPAVRAHLKSKFEDHYRTALRAMA